MGCGASTSHQEDCIRGDEAPRPESDVDVASTKDFDQEHKEALALRDTSAATRSSYHSEYLEKPAAPADKLSLRSMQGELPPLSPPRRSKGQLIPHASFFADTDTLVSKTPNSATTSVINLAFYLTSSCHSDLHSVRAIFCWLALNITYDSKCYLTGSTPPQEPEYILMRRKAICVGFAQFCEVLCNLADIPCITVQGITKGYTHDPEAVYSQSSGVNHVWNLVLVQGEWRPLDVAWGAGFLRDDGTFQQQLNGHWFLTDPDEFLPTHFPFMYRDLKSSKVYQLVHEPIDINTFSSRLRLDHLAYHVGLKPLTHENGVIEDVNCDVTIKFRVTKHPLRAVNAHIRERSDSASRKDRSGVLTSWDDDDTVKVYVRPPRAVTYLLTIMGQAEDDEKGSTLQRVCVFSIRCKQADTNILPFPQIEGSWGLQFPMATDCGLTKIKDRTFKFNAKVGVVTVPIRLHRHTEIAVKLRHAENMEDDLARYTFVEYGNDGDADIKARLPSTGYYLLRVFASHSQLKGLQHVADYLLYSDTKCEDCVPFPRSSDFAHKNHTQLVQPLVRAVSRGVTSLFRVHAPRLSRMRVNGLKMERRESDDVWEAKVTPAHDGKTVTISGSVERDATQLFELYTFDVV